MQATKKAQPLDHGIFGALSPFIMLCKLEFEHSGLRQWENDDVVRCATLLKVTPRELCAMVGLFTERKLQGYWRKNSWPLEVSIQFSKLRRFHMGIRHLDVQDKLVVKTLAAA